MRKTYLIVMLSAISFLGFSQTDSVQQRLFTFDFGIGGDLSSFQDLKYSAVHWTGIGTTPRFEANWRKKSIHSAGLETLISFENPKTFDDAGHTTVMEGILYYKYMHPIKTINDRTLFVGAKVVPYSLYYRLINDLSNNASYIIQTSSAVKGMFMCERQLSDKVTLNASLGLQLFALMFEGVGFAYATDQDIMEKGDYNYNDINVAMSFRPMWDYLDIETDISVSYGKRWKFGYSWRMNQSYVVENYTMTKGYSSLNVTYHIWSRLKPVKK